MRVMTASNQPVAGANAEWLAAHPQVAKVNHPALPGSKGHEFWKRDFTGASGLFSIVLHERYSQAQIDAFNQGILF